MDYFSGLLSEGVNAPALLTSSSKTASASNFQLGFEILGGGEPILLKHLDEEWIFDPKVCENKFAVSKYECNVGCDYAFMYI